jgi:hypothetical protein
MRDLLLYLTGFLRYGIQRKRRDKFDKKRPIWNRFVYIYHDGINHEAAPYCDYALLGSQCMARLRLLGAWIAPLGLADIKAGPACAARRGQGCTRSRDCFGCGKRAMRPVLWSRAALDDLLYNAACAGAGPRRCILRALPLILSFSHWEKGRLLNGCEQVPSPMGRGLG